MKKLKTLLILLAAALSAAILLSHLAAQRANRAAERRRIMAGLGNRMPADDNRLPESLLRRRLISGSAEGKRLNGIPKNNDGTASAGCLHNVRAHAEAYRAAVAQYAELLANADRLTQYGDLDVLFGDPASDPLPRYQYLVYQTTPAALDWLDGKPQAAFARICRNLHTGKTLQQSRNGLIPTMIGVAVIQRNTQLAAEMLAEQPQWAERLPENCAAFAPISAEHNAENYCRTVQAEYRFISAAIADTPNQLRQEMPAWLVPAVFSPEHSQALAAQRLSFACEPSARQAFVQDLPVSAPPDAEAAQNLWRQPACLRNLAGCVLFNESLGHPFDNYARRMQDMQMQQRALQAALALYRLPEHQRAAELPNILAQHGSPARPLRYDAETKSIVFAPYNNHPLPDVLRIPIALPQR